MRTLERPEDLRDVLGVPFTQEQLDAATAPLGPGLVVAGAGSGKTSVMAARVVWLVGTGQVEPERVLGLTFTNKAAGELASRIRSALAALGAGGDGEPVVSTYHAFAGRLVADHGLRLGVEPRSRLLADASRFQLAGRVLRRHRGALPHLTRPTSMLLGDLVALESELSEHLVDPVALQEWDVAWIDRCQRAAALAPTKGLRDDLEKWAATGQQRRELCELVVDLRQAKRELDALDFGDQVAVAARLAELVPEVGELERAGAGVVLLDEYQDTSVAQRRMLAALFGDGHPVTAVGDPCQAIYGWRGASVANLDGFPQHFPQASGEPAPVFSLAQNQRSGGRLLALANRLTAALRGRHRVVELTAPPAKAELGRTVVALHETFEQECGWVAEQVVAAHAAGTPWQEIAVLVRARKDFAPLHAALVAREVPVEVVGLGGLLALPEVADLVAVLEVLDEPTANAALLRLLTGPRWRLGVRDLAQLGRRGRDLLREGWGDPALDAPEGAADPDDKALEEAVAGVDPCDVVSLSDVLDRPGHRGWSPEGLQRLTQVGGELRELRSHRDEPLLDLVHRVVAVTGLDVELAASPEAVAARRSAGLAAFVDVVAGFTDLDGESSLTSFLAYLRAAQEHERGLDATTPQGSDAVQLLTAHKAKGLEWDVVVCPDLTAKVFPSESLRDRWTSSAWVLPSPLRGDSADQPPLTDVLDKESLATHDQACRDHLEREETRLGYVAFTRARTLLIGSGHWWGPTQSKVRGPSPFLRQLREHADEGAGTVEVWAERPEGDNPQLAAGEELVWPAPYEPEPLARRQAAATAVRDDLATLLGGGALPADDGLTVAERALFEELDREAALLVSEARETLTATRPVELPRALTASQLLRLQDDPDAFARELARPLPRQPAPAARRGTRFHSWVEGLFDARPLLDVDDLTGARDDELPDEELQALQQAFLASEWATRKPYEVEAPFALPLAGRVVRGRIDAVYDLGPDDPRGRWQVVDWKTGRELADPLQLAVYRLAWARLRDVPEEQVVASFLYVRTGREVVQRDLPGAGAIEALLRGDAPAEAGLLF